MAFSSKHLLGIEHLSSTDITAILDLAETYVDLNRKEQKQGGALSGMTQINMFFENSKIFFPVRLYKTEMITSGLFLEKK